MLVSSVALLKENPHPGEAQVLDALGGVLCRCTGYRKIVSAVLEANQISPQPATMAAGHGPVVDGDHGHADDEGNDGCDPAAQAAGETRKRHDSGPEYSSFLGP